MLTKIFDDLKIAWLIVFVIFMIVVCVEKVLEVM